MENLSYFAFFLLLIIVACQEAQQQSGEKNREPDNFIETKEIAKEPENLLLLNFIAAEPRRNNEYAVEFLPFAFKTDWQQYASKRIQPKSAQNPEGWDTANISYGDFGYYTISSQSMNVLLQSDTSFYFAISGGRVLKLEIDSMESMITYSKYNESFYNGCFIGYSKDSLENISFLIQSNSKNIPELFNVRKLTKEDLIIVPGNNQSKSKLSLKWADDLFTGFSEETEILLSDSRVITIKNNETYLLCSWTDDGIDQQCESNYELFLLQHSQLKLIRSNSYHCDI